MSLDYDAGLPVLSLISSLSLLNDVFNDESECYCLVGMW